VQCDERTRQTEHRRRDIEDKLSAHHRLLQQHRKNKGVLDHKRQKTEVEIKRCVWMLTAPPTLMQVAQCVASSCFRLSKDVCTHMATTPTPDLTPCASYHYVKSSNQVAL
jgi:hypothetical protein